ncbi:MAG: response regulator [Erythrobacter sp.]
MSISEQVSKHLPFLRRYARALSGSQASGDAIVRATLEAALSDTALKESLEEGRIPLYRAFNKVWSNAYLDTSNDITEQSEHETGAQVRLGAITLMNRQALLLTTLEDFTPAQAAEILEIEASEVNALVDQAVSDIDHEQATTVLIIEDEPLISMQLEDLVSGLGHEICGTAATRTQAIKLAEEKPPGLVLADIQLADGSSGLDAVDDILAMESVPAIFITAYPERLLTGNRPEPTYLITKPFEERTVRAAISQALFFGSSKPL